MRPVKRGASPQTSDFDDYSDAKPYLIQRLGSYCSYCERHFPALLAVEHIHPKKLRPELEGRWDNFLLSCGNCNPSKGADDLNTADYFFPDRDNTLAAFEYCMDGSITPSKLAQAKGQASIAKETIDLTSQNLPKEEDHIAPISRKQQRLGHWLLAQDTVNTLKSQPSSQALQKCAIALAKSTGFFSIWMTAFGDDEDLRNRLIDAFPGTRDSGCFDRHGKLITPAPNPDNLENGGKI